jgi:hypothetical protein
MAPLLISHHSFMISDRYISSINAQILAEFKVRQELGLGLMAEAQLNLSQLNFIGFNIHIKEFGVPRACTCINNKRHNKEAGTDGRNLDCEQNGRQLNVPIPATGRVHIRCD